MSTDAARPISSDWLTLRRSADETARQASLPLLDQLWRFLTHDGDDPRHRPHPDGAGHSGADHDGDRGSGPVPTQQPVEVFDLGAGTGANQAWLGPRLRLPQHWTLIDHDPELLEHASTTAADVTGVRTVVAGIEDLANILDNEKQGSARVVTCSALLDLLTPAQLRTLCGALADSGTAALFSLSVTGLTSIYPPDSRDAAINHAFNAHQQKGGRAGPRGVDLTEQYLRDAGFTISTAETPWLLADTDHAMITRFLQDRAAAAVEQDRNLERKVDAWLELRTRQVEDGMLTLTVGHRDLLALPPA